jgi:outer membrane lipopolysaccharide assembly protein LptE/RlpB
MAQMAETGKERNTKYEIRNSALAGTSARGSAPTAWCLVPNACRLLPTAYPGAPGLAKGARCLLLTACCLLFFTACGYHVAGQATRIPPDVKTIAVPAFKNMSSTFRIEQQLTSAVTREFLERTHYRILPNPADADAVLKGTIKEVRSRALTFDSNTGLATSLQVQVTADVKLEDVHSHKLLFSNSSYVFREEYQVSETASTLFEEDKPALERLSRDLARMLVTDILENF